MMFTYTKELEAEYGHLLSKPSSKRGKLQRAFHCILLQHAEDGALPTSNRFLFYEAEQHGIVSKQRTGERRADQPATEAVTWLRDKGIVPWDWIVDETRIMTVWRYAHSVTDYLADSVDSARIDCWDGEPPPLILFESRSLAGVLQDLAASYLCPIAATNGQSRGFLVTKIAPLLQDGRRVLYLGDFDWQGGQIEANTRKVLTDHAGELDWERLALTAVQVLISIEPNPGTMSYEHAVHEMLGEDAMRHLRLVRKLFLSGPFQMSWAVAYIAAIR